MAAADKVQQIVEKLITPPSDGQAVWKKVEHGVFLAVAAWLAWKLGKGLWWVLSHPAEARIAAMEAGIEVAMIIPSIREQVEAEERTTLDGIRKSLHGDGDPGELAA
jgi:hypothetical protein